MQIGWLDADSVIDQDGLDYLAIRDHLYQVGRSVLARLSNLDDMADGERREYFRDAHGLLASMTALLDRVGVDTTIQLRFPDGEAARTNENVRDDVVSFLARTRRRNSRATAPTAGGGRSSNLGRTSSSTACRWISTRPPAPPI